MDSEFHIEILSVVLGGLVLLLGRNIFWLVIGLMGFLLGVEVGRLWLVGQPELLIAIGAVALGVLGAVLAVLFERVAFGLAGFFAMTFLVAVLPVELGLNPLPPLAILLMGVLGAVVAVLVMDWAIIVLTAFVGAAVIVSALSLAPLSKVIGFVVLVLIGVLAQSGVRARRRVPR